MKPFEEVAAKENPNWSFAINVKPKKNPGKKNTVPGSQFEQPLLEFSGACAGCGETPYVKLLTQMFGDRMMMLMQLVVPLFGAHLHQQRLILSMIKDMDRRGAIPF